MECDKNTGLAQYFILGFHNTAKNYTRHRSGLDPKNDLALLKGIT